MYDAPRGPQIPLLVTELSGDNIRADWETAYNKGCALASSDHVQVFDHRTAPVSQRTDILIVVHDAQNILDDNPRCRVVIDKSFERHQEQAGLMLLIVMVGPKHKEAIAVAQTWLPEPPYRSLSFEGLSNPTELTGVIATWCEAMVTRDRVRWPRSASGYPYEAEGRDFV